MFQISFETLKITAKNCSKKRTKYPLNPKKIAEQKNKYKNAGGEIGRIEHRSVHKIHPISHQFQIVR
jgi:hypothetical protein